MGWNHLFHFGLNFPLVSSWICLPRFWVLLANVSFGGLFAASDKVRSSGHIWAKSANCVQLVWPACFRVNPYNALEWVNQYAIHLWVNLYVTHLCMNLYDTCLWVNLYDTHLLVNQYTHPYVNMYCNIKQVDPCASCQWEKQYATQWVDNLSQFKGSDVSIWRDSTALYNVADHPFFVFHPKPVHCSSFSETFKIYPHHLLQYWLVCVIEFVLHWSNHWCHLISKHACMLVYFNLTPQQLCQGHI